VREAAAGRASRRSGAAAAALVLLLPAAAGSVEFFDGRLQIHGFYEAQVRSIAKNYSPTDNFDLTQWYNVLDLEVEAELAPDGWGPFDLISSFSRVEVRYDCVWTHACTLFDSANAYGHRSLFGKDPRRLLDGHRDGFTGTIITGDRRRYSDVSFFDPFSPDPQTNILGGPAGSFKVIRVWQQAAFTRQFATSPGDDQVFDPPGSPLCPLPLVPSALCGRELQGDVSEIPTFVDDPGLNVMRRTLDCFYGAQRTRGPTNGQDRRDLLLSIDGCRVRPIAYLRDIPNPFNPNDFNPWLPDRVTDPRSPLFGTVIRDSSGNPVLLPGSTALPFRPFPTLTYDAPGQAGVAQGIFYPTSELSRLLRKDKLSNVRDFTEEELAWNRGASQEQTKELKELYLDLELLEGRLWLRAGKQNIVWGKTELFRTTDQFNPQDLALASLPSLEESRIALWALRGVYSLYDVGPLEDVRLELAMNYDEFQPVDLGVCGEPYTLDVVCGGYFGLQVHGILGLGVAGFVQPPDPWDSSSGIEVGGRVEWRWDRFSFALSDFWGYDDIPSVEQISRYSRNVDPQTGRPRRGSSTGPCSDPAADPDCLTADTALTDHYANQQLFAWICAMTIGVTALDTTACGNTIFNSFQNLITREPATDPLTEPTLASFASALLAGNGRCIRFPSGQLVCQGALGFAQQGFGVALPTIVPNEDVGDTTPGTGFFSGTFPTLNQVLTTEQQALLGCGSFYSTDCDVQGFDLLNVEASAFFQSFAGFEGTFGSWDTTDPSVPQPGTVFFQGGPVCTRYDGAGGTTRLPGCRGPGDPGYDVAVDGSTTIAGGGQRNLVQPFFDPASPFFQGVDGATPCQTPSATFNGCQLFENEMAAISWNLQMILVGFSSSSVVSATGSDVLDPDDPFGRLPENADRCSFRQPALCIGVGGFLDFTGVQRTTVRAGGNGTFGRRDFVWQIGTPLLVQFEKRNVLGFSMDWAEDLTKSNWSIEATWIEDTPSFDADSPDSITRVDTYNLTISVDRPTFVNFLNKGRTFFLNSQWFFQYIDGYRKGFPGSGPFNTLATFTALTGYFQDRLLPAITFVYDLPSNSGAVLPSIQYRFTENLSVTVGLADFFGRESLSTTFLTQIGPANRVGRHRDKDGVEQGLAVLSERDEVFLRVKYTF
jgi:hypothetical protein